MTEQYSLHDEVMDLFDELVAYNERELTKEFRTIEEEALRNEKEVV